MALRSGESGSGGAFRLAAGTLSRTFGPLFRIPLSGLMALLSGEPGPGGAFRLLAGTLSRAFGPPFRSGIGDSGGIGSESFSAWVGYSFPYFSRSRGPGPFPRIESRVWWVGAKSGVLTAERDRDQAA